MLTDWHIIHQPPLCAEYLQSILEYADLEGNEKQIQTRLKDIMRISKGLLNMNSDRVQTMNLLYQHSQSNSGSNMSIFSGVKFMASQTMQYCNYGDRMDGNPLNEQYINFTSVVNSILIAMDITNTFTLEDSFMVLNTTQQIYAQWPAPVTAPAYRPLQRPWVTGHVAYREEYRKDLWISPIYQFYYAPPVFGISITQSLLLNDTFMGVVGSDVDFSKLQSLLIGSHDNLMMLYEDGTILFQNTYLNVTLEHTFYIYNTSISGFNQSQWEQFKLSDRVIYTHNSVFNQQMALRVAQFTNLPFYFLIFSNITDYQLIQVHSDDIINSLIYNQVEQLLYTLLVDIFVIMIAIYMFHQILSPITRIQNHVRQVHRINKITWVVLSRSSNVLLQLENKLIQSIQKLNKLSSRKSEECIILERYNLPKSQNSLKLDLDGITYMQPFKSYKGLLS